jgi:signal transduction histidine kinase
MTYILTALVSALPALSRIDVTLIHINRWSMSSITKLLIPLTLGCAVSISVLVFSERSFQRLSEANQLVSISLETQAVTSELLALLSDAETAQRGLILTGRPQYLEPYMMALPQIDPKLRRLRQLTAENREQREHVAKLAKLVGEKLAELGATLTLYKKRGAQAARALIETDVGRRTMDGIRQEVGGIQEGARAELIRRSSRWNEDVAVARFGLAVITVFSLILVIAIYLLARRGIVQRERVRRTLEHEVRERTRELSELSSSLQNLQEEERARLAHDLHDELGSILVATKMDVSWVHGRLKERDPALAQKLARAMGSLDEGVDIKRRIIEELRPTTLDALGLPAAIDWHVNQVGQRANLKCEVSIKPADIELPSAVSIALFRVLQEALTNIVRHAKAANAWITLEQDERGLKFEIRDDGIGLPQGAEHKRLSHGILGMRQRIAALGGDFEIASGVGMGTRIRMFVPLPPGAYAAAAPSVSLAPAAAAPNQK